MFSNCKMNYNYKVNNNVQKIENKDSKYTYCNNQLKPQIFIFELILKDKFNNIKIIRRIKKSNQGNLISPNDNISYNIIDKYKLTAIDANYPDRTIIVKESVNSNLTSNTYLNDDIYLEINQNSNRLMDFNYFINLNQ